MRKVVSHVQSLSQQGSPPPITRPVVDLWADLPKVNRKHLLRLLSHLLERQLEPNLIASKEGGDECDDDTQ
jgi:hypothetical protein